MPVGIYKHHPQQGFQKGHLFYGDLSKPNYFQKGNTPWSRGKTASLEVREKQRQAKLGKIGEQANSWKGGITPVNKIIRMSIDFRLWREAVFARDNWTCQKYGVKGGKLHPHHVQNFAQFPELRFAVGNGVTLSEKAHREFHKKYGKKNNTKEQLEEFLERSSTKKN